MIDRIDRLVAAQRMQQADVERFGSALALHAASPRLTGAATAAACGAYVDRLAGRCTRVSGSGRLLGASAIGIGTHRGEASDRVDASYARAIHHALLNGVNRIDTAGHYRGGRAERCVGAAVRLAIAQSGLSRDAVLVGSKAGFAYRSDGQLRHSLEPGFLRDQLARSLERLGMETIDILYLHNPELRLRSAGAARFASELADAFELLEDAVVRGLIGGYGIATWDGLWCPALDIERIVELARRVAGDAHHLRHLQTPLDTGPVDPRRSLQADLFRRARDCGLAIVVSAALRWGRVRAADGGTRNACAGGWAARSVLRCLAAPGVAAALVGMRQAAHLDEMIALNLGLRRHGYR